MIPDSRCLTIVIVQETESGTAWKLVNSLEISMARYYIVDVILSP